MFVNYLDRFNENRFKEKKIIGISKFRSEETNRFDRISNILISH